MRNIKEMTENELSKIATLATGGYYLGEFSANQREIETGGYGKRRLVRWTFDDELNYFEINKLEN